jgi:two-component system, sensor histidine kinase
MSTPAIAAETKKDPYQHSLRAEMVRHLYRQAPIAQLGMAAGSALLVFVLWNTSNRAYLLFWLLGHSLVTVLRLALIATYFRAQPGPTTASRWAAAAAAGSLLSSSAWGLACILFFDPTQPLSIMIITVILLALTGGSAAILSANLLSFWSFVAPQLGTLFVTALWYGGLESNAVAFIAAFGAVANFMAARNTKRLHTEAFRLGYENVALVNDLKRREAATEAARRSAEQANAAKTRFLAAASHDLRQPIHALGLLFATLAERVRTEQTAPLLDQIDDSVQAVDTMLNSLLDISKLDAGVVQPNIGPIDIGALFQRLNSEQQPIADLTGNRLRVRASNTTVQSDGSMLHRILANFIANALRYTHNGRILVGARLQGDAIRIDVIDTGPGIPPESLEDIFVEFHQLGNPERDRRRGLGLGLAIVKRLAELLGHNIEVRSRVGHGSRFSITVPRSSTQQAIVRHDGQVNRLDADLDGTRVLVLDDEVAVREAMRHLLERWGCTVSTVASPEEAEAAVRTGIAPPDLMIVDYRLRHHASGIETIGRLRALAAVPVPAMIITGDTAPDRLREAEASGYPLLHKPVLPDQLRRAILQLLVEDSNRHDAAKKSN